MKSTDQKLIMINGVLNSGKSVIFNLFKKEGHFICMDLSQEHFPIYENDLLNDLGKENLERIIPFVKSTEIYLQENFLREVGYLMKQRPNFHFVIKPGFRDFAREHYQNSLRYRKDLKRYTPLKRENIHHLMIFRHPKLAWATVTLHKSDLTYHTDVWTNNTKNIFWKSFDLLKIEDIKNHSLMKELIKNTDLNKVKPYTNFDLQVKQMNDYTGIERDLKIIEKRLTYIFEKLDYDKRCKDVKRFMKDSLTEEEKKIDWLTHL